MKKKFIGIVIFLITASVTYYSISYFNKKSLNESFTVIGVGENFCITYSSQCSLNFGLRSLELSCNSSKVKIVEQDSNLSNGETILNEVGKDLEYKVYGNNKKYSITLTQTTEKQKNRKTLWLNPSCDYSTENSLTPISNLTSKNGQ
jgi:hypothetical protein